MENAEGKRCGRCGHQRPLSAFGIRRAAKDGLQHWCRDCFVVWAAQKRPRKMAVAPTVPAGHKWCRRCGETTLAEEFALHTSRPDRLQVHCRACQAAEYRRKQGAEGKVVRPPDVPETHKFCRGCQRVLPLSDWPRRVRSADGYAFRCRECISTHDREKALLAKYGMTSAEVEAMREAQGGKCAICRTAPAVHVDHDHGTGKVRGMLCFSCNAGLGHFRDEPRVLRRAARYLHTDATTGTAAGPTSHRDEVAWEIVLRHRAAVAADPALLDRLVPSGGQSVLERLFAARLAEHSGGPAA